MFTITPGARTTCRSSTVARRFDPPGDVRAAPSGLLVVGIGLLENLEANRARLTCLALGLVFASASACVVQARCSCRTDRCGAAAGGFTPLSSAR